MNESYNFNYRSSLTETQQRIVETVEKNEIPITPKEIASITGINHNSVKVHCKTLNERGFIVKEYRGHYTTAKKVVTSERYGSPKVTSEVLPRLHNLAFTFSSIGERGIVKELDYDLAKVKVVIASNGSANVYVSCSDNPLDYLSYSILMACVKRELKVPDDTSVTVFRYEFNTDLVGIQLDGVKSLTLTAFDGSFERLYQKRENVLRSEVRAVDKTSPEAIHSLLRGGVSAYNIMQTNAMLINEIRQEREAQKFTNELLLDMINQNRRLLEHLEKKEKGSP